MVFDGHRRHAEAARIQIDQLQEGLHAAQHAQRIGSVQAGAHGRHREPVGFILLRAWTGALA